MKKKKVDHLIMGWRRVKVKEYHFPDDFEVVNYDKSQEQRDAFYYLWNGVQGSQEEVNNIFLNKFENCPDCHPEKDTFFVKHNGQYIGSITAIYHPKTNCGHIHYVVLKEDYRGQKLSRPLMYLAMNKIYNDGSDFAFLSTDDWRVPAIKLYLSCGFLPRITEILPHKKKKKILRWEKFFSEQNLGNPTFLNRKYKQMK